MATPFKIISLSVLSFLLASLLQAQVPHANLANNGVYLSANDYSNNNLTRSFNNGEGLKFRVSSSAISIKALDTIYSFYNNNIWGYRANGTDWRIYNKEFYRVDYTDKIILYTLPGCSVCSNFQTLYFSTDLNSPPYQLTRKNLKEAYHNNSRLVQELEKQSFIFSPDKRDKKSGRYLFLKWL